MSAPSEKRPSTQPEIDRAAATWVLRRDRGLTAAEQDALSQWLAADPRHGEALALQRWGWDELDRLTGLQTSLGAVPDADLFAPRRARVRILGWTAAGALLALAAGAAFLALPSGTATSPTRIVPPVAAAAPRLLSLERQTLGDGSVVELNRGAEMRLAWTAVERRVVLVRGEASFTVARDPERPFVVAAGGVEVRALGTVFNVRCDPESVEIVVAEGRVRIAAPAAPTNEAPIVEAGQQAVVPVAGQAAPARVVTLSPAQLQARLAWQPRLLDFTDAPLATILAEFNRRNDLDLTIRDAELAALRLSATFRSDNVEGFLRLMESEFGIATEWTGARTIVLQRRR
jgi:transmembrane sensor